jgi:hypothetical protein
MRVFHDRLINHQDKDSFYVIMSELASKHFGQVQTPLFLDVMDERVDEKC